jgi:hypothetical protein
MDLSVARSIIKSEAGLAVAALCPAVGLQTAEQ